jgi:hypothetical protein
MSAQKRTRDSAECQEFFNLFGRAPVLLNENEDSYYDLLAGFIEEFPPKSIVIKCLIRQVTNDTFETIRIERNKTTMIDREVQEISRLREQSKAEATVPKCYEEASVDECKAFERKFDSYERFDALIERLAKRRIKTLDLIAHYQEAMAERLRDITDQMIDQVVNPTAPSTPVAPPIAPSMTPPTGPDIPCQEDEEAKS